MCEGLLLHTVLSEGWRDPIQGDNRLWRQIKAGTLSNQSPIMTPTAHPPVISSMYTLHRTVQCTLHSTVQCTLHSTTQSVQCTSFININCQQANKCQRRSQLEPKPDLSQFRNHKLMNQSVLYTPCTLTLVAHSPDTVQANTTFYTELAWWQSVER